MSTENQTTKVVTGKSRLSYCHIWEPVSVQDGADKKYSVAVLIPKSDTATLAKIEAAVNAAKEIGKTSKWGGKIPPAGKLKLPLRDGDSEVDNERGDTAYHGHYFINCSSKTAPGVVDKNLNKIIDKEEVFSGCYGRVSINFYPFDVNGNKGVAAGLNNIQKLADGERLAGGSTAEQDFAEAFEDDADDLLG